MEVVVAAFNQEKALVGVFSVIVQLCRLIVNSSSLHLSQVFLVSTKNVLRSVILGVQVAVPGARLLLLPTRTKGRARSHGGAGHYSTARDRRVLPLFGGLLRKSRYGNHSKRVKKMFQIALHSKYCIYNARLWKDAVFFYVSIIFLLWLETLKVLNLVFCGSSIPFQ